MPNVVRSALTARTMKPRTILKQLKELQLANSLVAIYAHGDDGEDAHNTVGAIITASDSGILIRDIALDGKPLDLTFITMRSLNMVSYGTQELASSVYGSDYYIDVSAALATIDSMEKLAAYAIKGKYMVRLWLDFTGIMPQGTLSHFKDGLVHLEQIDQNGMQDGTSLFEAESVMRLECRDLRN